ncbi:MAG: DMT family transporter [Chloroflexota bacterium]|nr:DMT family transporter [Chloroflexota bacterium]
MAAERQAGKATAPPAPAPVRAILPELALLTVVILWSSTFVLTKDAFEQISPLAFAFIRFLLITVLAFGVLAVRGLGSRRGRYWRIDRADLARFAIAGFFGYTLYQLGFVLGLERTSPFSSSLLIAMVPLFTMLIVTALGDRPPPIAWLGLAVAIAGVVLFLSDREGGGSWAGNLISLGAGLAFATYGVLNRPLVARYPPETVSAFTTLAGSIPLLLVSLPAARAQDWAGLGVGTWLVILYMVVLPVYVAYILWNWAIARRGVAIATSASLSVPIVSGILSALFYAEGFGVLKVAGAALALLGLVLMRLPSWPDVALRSLYRSGKGGKT